MDALVAVAERERVDVVFPQSSAEVGAISRGADRFGVPVLVASADAVERASAKSETARLADRLGIPQPVTDRGGRRGRPSARPPASSATPAATSA